MFSFNPLQEKGDMLLKKAKKGRWMMFPLFYLGIPVTQDKNSIISNKSA